MQNSQWTPSVLCWQLSQTPPEVLPLACEQILQPYEVETKSDNKKHKLPRKLCHRSGTCLCDRCKCIACIHFSSSQKLDATASRGRNPCSARNFDPCKHQVKKKVMSPSKKTYFVLCSQSQVPCTMPGMFACSGFIGTQVLACP